MKICPLGAELFHVDGPTDGQTDRYDEANSQFLTILGMCLKTFLLLIFTSTPL